jgi:Peptidase family M48
LLREARTTISYRSAHSNAYFFGLGKNKRIVLYDTLVEQCSPAQIVAVLAHELGVRKGRHRVTEICDNPCVSATLACCSSGCTLLSLTHTLCYVQHWKMGHVTRNLLLANAVLLCQFALFGVVQHNDNVLASFGFEKQRPALARFIIFTVRVLEVYARCWMAGRWWCGQAGSGHCLTPLACACSTYWRQLTRSWASSLMC